MSNFSLIEKIIPILNDDPKGMSRFLQANPFTRLPFYTYDGLITPEEFIKYLYMESPLAHDHTQTMISYLSKNSGKNTLFIVGYQGCGKTTFVNSLIYHFVETKKLDNVKMICVDCDKYGASSERSPLQLIFTQCLIEFIECEPEKKICDFIDFFDANTKVIGRFLNNERLFDFYKLVEKVVIEGYSFKNYEEIVYLSKFVKNELELKDILYLIILMSLASEYNCSRVNFDPTVLFIDNLDYIDDFYELKRFTTALDDFTMDMSDSFKSIKFYKDSDVRFSYIDKIKVVVAMRETTRASLPKSHFSDAFIAIYETFDITEWYNKSEIIQHRLDYLDSGSALSSTKKRERALINRISYDTYTKNIVIPLFNNNYRSAIHVVTKIISENLEMLLEYSDICEKVKYGARGILLRSILNEFCVSGYGTESCFKKIGVLDLLDRKNNKVSVPRMVLTYLSNFTDTRCDDASNCISLQDVLEAYGGIISKYEIKKSIGNMYELQDSIWTHLISFSQIERLRNPTENGWIDYQKDIDLSLTKLHYSCAGKIYLEHITSHFEFFSARIYKTKFPALFCKANQEKNSDGDYKFIEVIKGVFAEVKRCCESLRQFNEQLCSNRGYSNPYSGNMKDYSESPYVCQYKKNDGRRTKQFHEDSMINAHIGYIDRFRVYVLKYSDVDDKPNVNMQLLDLLSKYVALLEKILINDYTRITLIPYYAQQLKEAKSKPLDFSIELNTTDE